MRRILVASDFSARSNRAARRATLLARTYGSSITVVHVVDDNPVLMVEIRGCDQRCHQYARRG
jgi:nucleotide-binding universal stress UspA family protein